MKLLAAVAVVALSAAPALADEDTSPKSENVAMSLSLAGTATSIALMYGGLANDSITTAAVGLATSLVTPALGHMYSGRYLTIGMGIRAAGAAMFVVGAEASSVGGNGDTLMMLGITAFGAGVIYDLATARSAARRYNRDHANFTFSAQPVASASGVSGLTFGANGTF